MRRSGLGCQLVRSTRTPGTFAGGGGADFATTAGDGRFGGGFFATAGFGVDAATGAACGAGCATGAGAAAAVAGAGGAG